MAEQPTLPTADRGSCPRCPSAAATTAGQASAPPDPPRRGWLSAAAAFPAAVLPLLPSFTCPACIAAYAGVLSALGLGFVLNEAFLAPLIAVFLVLGVGTVAWSTRSHRNLWPLELTSSGALAIAAGRLVWDVPAVLYAGAAAVLAGSVWNLWLKRPRRSPLVRIGAPAPPEGGHS